MPLKTGTDPCKFRCFAEEGETFLGSQWVSQQARVRNQAEEEFRAWLHVGPGDGTAFDGPLHLAWPRERSDSFACEDALTIHYDDETLSNDERPQWASRVDLLHFELTRARAYYAALRGQLGALRMQDQASHSTKSDLADACDKAELMRQYLERIWTHFEDSVIVPVIGSVNELLRASEEYEYTQKCIPALTPFERQAERLMPLPNFSPPEGFDLADFQDLRCLFLTNKALIYHVASKYSQESLEFETVNGKLKILGTLFESLKHGTSAPNSLSKSIASKLQECGQDIQTVGLLTAWHRRDFELMLTICKVEGADSYRDMTWQAGQSRISQPETQERFIQLDEHMRTSMGPSTRTSATAVPAKPKKRKRRKRRSARTDKTIPSLDPSMSDINEREDTEVYEPLESSLDQTNTQEDKILHPDVTDTSVTSSMKAGTAPQIKTWAQIAREGARASGAQGLPSAIPIRSPRPGSTVHDFNASRPRRG